MSQPITEFNLIRHGETDWNVARKYQGSADIPLNETGIAQAEALGESMRGEQWDAIYSSDLSRAMATAKAVATGLDFPIEDIVPDARLRERAYGVAEGSTLAEREAKWPGNDWDGLETNEAVQVRGLAALGEMALAHLGGKIIVVAHGGFIQNVLTALSEGKRGVGIDTIKNTSRTTIVNRDDVWEIGEVSVVTHWPELAMR